MEHKDLMNLAIEALKQIAPFILPAIGLFEKYHKPSKKKKKKG